MQNNTFSSLFVGQNIVKLKEIDSTNNYLKHLLSNCEPLQEGTVIMADTQFAGRGQRGNVWLSEAGKNLTISIFLKPVFLAASQQFELTKVISLGVTDCLTNLLGEDCKVKWPNDIYIGNQKIGGILIENTLKGAFLKDSVVGIGLNVNQLNFSHNLRATSVANILHREYHLNQLLSELCYHIEGRYLQLKANKKDLLYADYMNRLFRFNQLSDFIINHEKVSARIIDVNPNGKLIVSIAGDIQAFDFKEIAFVI